MNKKGLIFGNLKSQKFGKRGQIWVETVIYTLIAFTLMGLVLAFVVPKVEETRDRGIIEQSIAVLQDIDSVIRSLGGPGNQRVLELGINKGSLTVDAAGDRIFFEIESKYQYSQPGEDVSIGKILAHTETQGKINIVTLTLDYSTENYNINYQLREESRVLSKAPVPYGISISDRGTETATGKTIINIEVT